MPLLIINHHYFREEKYNDGIYPINIDELNNEIKILKKNNWKIGNQIDMINYLNKKKEDNEKLAILTFDDGLKEQLKAVDLLLNSNASCICFCPTMPIKEKKVLNVHKLHLLRAFNKQGYIFEQLKSNFDFKDFKINDELIKNQYRYDSLTVGRLKYYLNFIMQEQDIEKFLITLFEKSFGDENEYANKFYFNENDLIFLIKNNMLGSHAEKHKSLGQLNNKSLKNELNRSFDFIYNSTGKTPLGISYPFGGVSAVSKNIFKYVKKSGYKYGITMNRGINYINENLNVFALKRIDVNDINDWVF